MFLFVGLADLNWILFILLPVVLGLSIGALPHKTYTIWGAVIADGDHAGVNVYTWFVGASLYRDGIANYHSPDFS